MTPETRLELQRLLSALCDGELPDAGHTRLQELLRADSECRRLYLEYLDLHARLLHPHLPVGPSLVPERSPPGRRWSLRQPFRYALVAGLTLAASLLVQLALVPRPPVESNPTWTPDTREGPQQDGVATVTQTADCVWENGAAWRAGSRLLPGEMRLQSGNVRIHFDSGVDLVVEGPAVLRIDSVTAVSVTRGKVVVQGDETTGSFDLHTPSATLVDFGNEYAVAVSAEGEEVHVFDGEVQRRVNSPVNQAEPERLQAGQARRYDTSAAPGQRVPLDETRFVRHLADPGAGRPDPASGLLAYEGFDYRDPKALWRGRANGGIGWTTPWRGFSRPLDKGPWNRLTLEVKETLTRPGAATPGVGGCLDYAGFTKFHRRLATPIRMDRDGVYYLSFLFRRDGPSADSANTVAVLLRTTEELKNQDPRKRLNLGVGSSNRLFTFFDRASARTALPFRYGETYLLVAKIAASARKPDQVFLRVYSQDEPVEPEEPASWSLVGRPFATDLVFDYLELHIHGTSRQVLDEVRLGTTWPSVVSPWLPPARGRNDKDPG